jgi:hypothetical protein
MIISHKHKFIFIKTRKTAGTSFEMALGDHCGPKDIITRISMKDEKVRREICKRGAQNYRLPLATYSGRDWKHLLTKGRPKRWENHDTAERISGLLPTEQWKAYFKFCFERNPWDKMVSHYYWKKEAYKLSDFQEYIEKGEKGEIVGFAEIVGTRDQYSLNGEVVVDKIYKYEDMASGLMDLTQRFELETDLKMPTYRAKGQHRSDKMSYQELLTPAQADWVASKFAKEISELNYSF